MKVSSYRLYHYSIPLQRAAWTNWFGVQKVRTFLMEARHHFTVRLIRTCHITMRPSGLSNWRTGVYTISTPCWLCRSWGLLQQMMNGRAPTSPWTSLARGKWTIPASNVESLNTKQQKSTSLSLPTWESLVRARMHYKVLSAYDLYSCATMWTKKHAD